MSINFKYKDLWKYIREMHIIDSHMHIMRKERYGGEWPVSPLLSEQTAQGIVSDIENNPYKKEQWRIFLSETTGSEELSVKNITHAGSITNKKYYSDDGIVALFDDAKIAYAINDPGDFRIDPFFKEHRMISKIQMAFVSDIDSIEAIEQLEKLSGRRILNLTDLLEIAEEMVVEAKKNGATVIKNFSAYSRDLAYKKTPFHEAEACFVKLLNNRKRVAGYNYQSFYYHHTPEDFRPLQDFLVFHFCDLAAKYDMTIGFHTGPVHTSSVASKGARNLTDLAILAANYPHVKFNFMHGNMPYHHETAMFLKCLDIKNKSIDLNWCYELSPIYAEEALYFWLGSIPVDSIIAYGTDGVWFFENILVLSKLARRCVYRVLARYIDEHRLNEDDAMAIARKILFENPCRVFNIEAMKGSEL